MVLVIFMGAQLPVYTALAVGYVLFFAYGLSKGINPARLGRKSLSGIRSVAGILMAFFFIGMLTSSWRASGTIPTIVSDCLQLVSPAAFPLAAFLMVAIMSLLTGTSFGTAATMGNICMTLGNALECSPILVGGAILAGCYIGDRNSPLSTASLLVSKITQTDFSRNLALMTKRAVVPVVASCLLYLALGFAFPAAASGEASVSLPYGDAFHLGLAPLLPAASVLILALARVDVRVNMAVSTVLASAIALTLQQADPLVLAQQLLTGYTAPSEELARTLDGGGALSMLQLALIILISSTYAGLFKETQLLNSLEGKLLWLSSRIGRERALAVSALAICALCCNQTLSSIITQQLFAKQYGSDKQSLALDIEDTVIVLCAAVPWCIASSAPLAAIGAPTVSILAAFYLFLQPLWMIARAAWRYRDKVPIPLSR